jgi:hypothetical protein
MHIDDLLRAEDFAAETGDAVLAEPDHRPKPALAQSGDFGGNRNRFHVNDVGGADCVTDAAAGAALDVDALDHVFLSAAQP